ncbi:ChaN family lipoprotein [Rhodoferax sp.]|uniref:ChaN family lipoprotein n=1 Tax=Rhodoferax sp. TaxID=50421 RepID=UPI00374D1654
MAARPLAAAMAVLAVLGCTVPAHEAALPALDPVGQLQRLLPADIIFLGEQHDVPEHQRIQRVVVEALARQQALAALALEMASQGQSTATLGPQASEEQVRAALQWNNHGWPWSDYAPAVMAAVRAGIPVLGANLPKDRLAQTMKDTGLDALLSGAALQAQQERVSEGHCNLLPQDQIAPMTRIQIARDVAMAQTIAQATRPGQTVLLLAGASHGDRRLGVPLHLPRHLRVKTILLQAGSAAEDTEHADQFDQTWPTQAAPVKDYCADFIQQRSAAAAAAKSKKEP